MEINKKKILTVNNNLETLEIHEESSESSKKHLDCSNET